MSMVHTDLDKPLKMDFVLKKTLTLYRSGETLEFMLNQVLENKMTVVFIIPEIGGESY